MDRNVKKILPGAYVLMTAMFASAAGAGVDITANGGAVTQYIFRGVPQTDGGEHDQKPIEADYTFGSVTLEYNGFCGRFGTWGDDFDGDFWEVGYGNTLTVAEKDLFDYTFAIIRSDQDLSFKVDSDGNLTEDTFFYAGVVKTFDLFSN